MDEIREVTNAERVGPSQAEVGGWPRREYKKEALNSAPDERWMLSRSP